MKHRIKTIILGLQIFLGRRSLSSIGQEDLDDAAPPPSPPTPLFRSKEFIGGRLDLFGVLFIIFLSSYLSAFFVYLSFCPTVKYDK